MLNDYLHRIGWFSTDTPENGNRQQVSESRYRKSPEWQALEPEEQMVFCHLVHDLRRQTPLASPLDLQWRAYRLILDDRPGPVTAPVSPHLSGT